MGRQLTQSAMGATGSPRPGGHRLSLLSLVLLLLLLPLLVSNTSLALKLPTFLSSWRPTQSPSLSGSQQQLSNQINLPQETLMTSASAAEPEARPRFGALTRTHSHQHHHLPLHLFRSFPKSLFGRFLPASLAGAATPPAAKATKDASSVHPMLFDWSQLNGGAASPASAALERNPMMMSPRQPPLSQQPQSPFSNVYHFQATQPLQANHFSIDHDQQQEQPPPPPPPPPHQDSQPELQKHALGYGDNGEEFATVMAAAEPQASGRQQQQQQDIQTIQVGGGETLQAAIQTNETANWPAKVDQKHESQRLRNNESNSNSSGSIVVGSGNGGNNGSFSDDLLQLSDERKPQQANQSASRSNSSTLLTNLIGEELTRLKQEPDELNKTLSSMGQPLLALLMDENGQSDSKLPLSHLDNSSASDATPFVEQPTSTVEITGSNSNAPESGRSESAASAVVVVPPSHEAPEISAGSGGDQHEFVASSSSDAGSDVFSIGDGDNGDHVESFILGPFRGLTSDNMVTHHHHHEQPATQVYNSAPRVMQQQPSSVGMSMASNLIQQARSLIQLPFANGPASQVIHTPLASQQQQQAAAANRGELRHTAGLFRGQQQVAYLPSVQPDQLVEQATSPAPFSFAMTNNNYQRPQQATYQQLRPPTWPHQRQQSANFPSSTMMMPNHAVPHNNQQQRRPKNPFGFNRYFLMPSSTMASSSPRHLYDQQQQQQHHSYGKQQPSRQQQVSAKNVPYFAAEQQRPRTGDNDNNRAAGFQFAIGHSTQQDNSFGLEQARKKFKSGLYQIEPPRLVNESAADQTEQLRVAGNQHPAAPAEDDQQQPIKQELEQQEAESEGESNDHNDNEQLQLASSGASSELQSKQQQPVEFAAKQVGASIGFQSAAGASNQSTTKSHKGKVFNEPISSLVPLPLKKPAKQDKSSMFRSRGASPDEGQSVSQTKTLKHSEEVTLYEFDSAPRVAASSPPAASSAAQVTQKEEQGRPGTPAIDAGHQNRQQPPELLETQVFTVPYTITMQPNGQVSHFVAPPAQQPARMRPQNNFVQQREPPFAHSFIRNSWANPPAAAQRYFNQAAPPAQLPQLQYLAPPAVETVSRQQQQLFKTVFQEAQQASQPPVEPWAQPPLRSVPALAFVPQQQHYFHYQPLQHQQQQQQNLAQEQRQQSVIFELANQSPRQASRPLEQQQFAMAIDQSVGSNGNSVFARNPQSIGDDSGAKQQQQQDAPLQQQQTSPTGQPPSTTATPGSSTTMVSTTLQPTAGQANQRRTEPPEPTSLPPSREEDDDDRAEKLANLRSSPFNQQQRPQQQQQPSSPSAFCANRSPGLYADESQKCKAYYQCAPTGHQMFRCNNQTQFNQKTQNCDWWYNVNCAGQAADSELLPQSEPLQRPQQAASSEADATGGETVKSATASESNGEPQSLSALSSLEDSQGQQQVAPQRQQQSSSSSGSAMMEERLEDALGSSAASSLADQSAGSAQQQPAPTSSTPIYGAAADQQNGSGGDMEFPPSSTSSGDFSARSTTTQDPILLQPTTTTTTTSPLPTTTTTTTSTLASSSSAGQDEVQPQVGAQLNESAEQAASANSQQQTDDTTQIAFSSSTSISSGPNEPATTIVPASGDNRASFSKLSARSLSGPLERAAGGPTPGATIYSTSANQGSVSYTPMDTHQLTARAFQEAAATAGRQQSDHSTASASASAPSWLQEQRQQTRRPPLEKRFGARLQHAASSTPSTTTSTTDRPDRPERVH